MFIVSLFLPLPLSLCVSVGYFLIQLLVWHIIFSLFHNLALFFALRLSFVVPMDISVHAYACVCVFGIHFDIFRCHCCPVWLFVFVPHLYFVVHESSASVFSHSYMFLFTLFLFLYSPPPPSICVSVFCVCHNLLLRIWIYYRTGRK